MQVRSGQARPFGSIPRINPAHSLAQGLLSYNYDLGGILIDLVSGSLGAQNNSGTGSDLTRETSPYGAGYRYHGASGFSQGMGAGVNPRYAGLANSAPYAVAMGFYQATTPVTSHIMAIRDAGGNISYEVQSNSTGSTGNLQVIFAGSTAGDQRSNTASGTNSNNKFHTVIGNAISATSGNVYADGSLDSSFSGNAMTATTTAAHLFINSIDTNNNGSSGVDGFVYFVGMWNRVLTAYEAFQIHNDPYCFLIYPEDEMSAMLVGVTAGYTPYNPWPQAAPILAQ